MSLNQFGGARESAKPINLSSASTPLSKGELHKRTGKGRRKNEEPIADTPRYVARVKRERAALALLQKQKDEEAKEGDSKAPTM